MILEILFFLSSGALVYSYALYPWLLEVLARGKKENEQVWNREDHLPEVLIVLSAYNEEKVIAGKIESVFNSTYPAEKIKLIIGSDNSSDRTDEIISSYAANDSRILFRPFSGRNGKSIVLNALVAQCQNDFPEWNNAILVLTDANVFFTEDTIFQLIKHFKNAAIGQVAANILNKGMREDGISYQEQAYIKRENQIKYHEGVLWGSMMGAFGACHALRTQCWKTIPRGYLMEDFYLSMNVLAMGYRAIKELKAICYEDVSNELSEELKRKTRIQAGNFQNLSSYRKLFFRFDSVSFCFLSHKVIRWFGPLLIMTALIANFFLTDQHLFFLITFWIQVLLLFSPVWDYVLKKAGIHIRILRFVSYFYAMNFALLKGMLMYLKGVKSNVWNPTQRNVS
jgi:cellulose synthase/poly-beta-1,6-N-acetylglucosamine synthase-like glycosyltransferase